jgi:hypothetical protein
VTGGFGDGTSVELEADAEIGRAVGEASAAARSCGSERSGARITLRGGSGTGVASTTTSSGSGGVSVGSSCSTVGACVGSAAGTTGWGVASGSMVDASGANVGTRFGCGIGVSSIVGVLDWAWSSTTCMSSVTDDVAAGIGRGPGIGNGRTSNIGATTDGTTDCTSSAAGAIASCTPWPTGVSMTPAMMPAPARPAAPT